jgi:hypothetical protein
MKLLRLMKTVAADLKFRRKI